MKYDRLKFRKNSLVLKGYKIYKMMSGKVMQGQCQVQES